MLKLGENTGQTGDMFSAANSTDGSLRTSKWSYPEIWAEIDALSEFTRPPSLREVPVWYWFALLACGGLACASARAISAGGFAGLVLVTLTFGVAWAQQLKRARSEKLNGTSPIKLMLMGIGAWLRELRADNHGGSLACPVRPHLARLGLTVRSALLLRPDDLQRLLIGSSLQDISTEVLEFCDGTLRGLGDHLTQARIETVQEDLLWAHSPECCFSFSVLSRVVHNREIIPKWHPIRSVSEIWVDGGDGNLLEVGQLLDQSRRKLPALMAALRHVPVFVLGRSPDPTLITLLESHFAQVSVRSTLRPAFE